MPNHGDAEFEDLKKELKRIFKIPDELTTTDPIVRKPGRDYQEWTEPGHITAWWIEHQTVNGWTLEFYTPELACFSRPKRFINVGGTDKTDA